MGTPWKTGGRAGCYHSPCCTNGTGLGGGHVAGQTVWQHSMSELVAARVGGVWGMPWEAMLWLSILQTRSLNAAVGDSITPKRQTNGIRQGSPDSSDLFGAIVARDLQCAVDAAGPQPPDPKGGPPPPRTGGSFLDDTYLWSQDRDHLQKVLNKLEKEHAEDGLQIHPTKTAILFSKPTGGGTFAIGGKWWRVHRTRQSSQP